MKNKNKNFKYDKVNWCKNDWNCIQIPGKVIKDYNNTWKEHKKVKSALGKIGKNKVIPGKDGKEHNNARKIINKHEITL